MHFSDTVTPAGTNHLTTTPRSICILRLSAIGDVTHVVPVARLLQKQCPDVQITWVIGRIEAQLVGDIPGIEFIIFDKGTGLTAYKRLRSAMEGRHFDILLHMQISLRASLASMLIPARIRLGYDHKRAKQLQWLFTNAKITPIERQHVLDSFLCFPEWMGLDTNELEWNIPVPDDAANDARQYLSTGEHLLLINPCSSVRLKNFRNWSVEGYAAVADHAITRYGVRVILTGGPSEQERMYAEQIRNIMRHDALNLVGKTNLKQLLALITQADLVIAPDTGPMHMAVAAGTPVIGLFATSNPNRSGPYKYRDLVVNAYPLTLQEFNGLSVEDAPWGMRVRHPDAMDRITTDMVIAKLDYALTSKP